MQTFWPDIGSNWGRWGADDERGTLNTIDDRTVREAAACVRTGRVLSLARPLDSALAPYYPHAAPSAFTHEMVTWWRSNAGGDVQAASDQVRAECHGLEITHMDALSHIGHQGRGYGGREFSTMAGPDGVSAGDILGAGPVVVRGVLADIPRLRRTSALPPGTAVGYDDVAAAAPGLSPGDALVVRTGRWSVPAAEDGFRKLSGLHPDALRYVRERDAAIVGTDGPGDTFPVPVQDNRLPVHVLSLVYLGVHLVHSMALDALADCLADQDRQDFMLVLAPLAIPGGTGSPINPVAVL